MVLPYSSLGCASTFSLRSGSAWRRFRRRKPRVLFAAAAVLLMWGVQDMLSRRVTPRYLASLATSSWCPLRGYGASWSVRLLVTCMTKHFPGLNSICHVSSQRAGMSRSYSRMAWPSGDLMVRYRRQLSAKSHALDLMSSGRSLINMRNKTGLTNTVPWGTPDSTSMKADYSPPTTTHCLRPARKHWIQLATWSLTP